MTNLHAPHTAIVILKIEIMETLKTGQLSNNPVSTTSKLFSILGDNYEDCTDKLNKFLERLQNDE